MNDVKTFDLANGCRLVLRPTPGKQILAMAASIRWGGRDDAPEQTGRSALMARLLTNGTAKKTACEIAETMESVGGGIHSAGALDAMGIDVQCVEQDWQVGFDLLTECLFESNFPQDEFDKEKHLVQTEIQRADDDKFSYTYRNFRQMFYEGHFYQTTARGKLETVGALQRKMLVELHKEIVRPENIILTIVGNVPEHTLIQNIEKTWPAKNDTLELPARRTAPCEPGAGAGQSLALEKETEQGFVMVGYRAPALGSGELTALRLISGVLGEGMSSRLFSRLRDRDHLAYVVGAQLVALHKATHLMLYIGTGPKTVDQAREGILREVDLLLSEPPDTEEFERARRYILGKHRIGRQTNSSQCSILSNAELSGQGWQWSENFPERFNAVTTEQALDAARKFLTNPAIVCLKPKPTH